MSASSQWCFGPFRLDAATSCLWRDDDLVELAPKPIALLTHLVAHAGQVVSKDELLDAVWPETVVSEGVLKTNMGLIRNILGETAKAPRYIVTVRGRGYRFIAPVNPVSAPLDTAEPVAERSPVVRSSAPVSQLASGGVVGRGSELTQLQQCFARAQAGERQIVLVSGEAGIGKTTLVETFVEHLRDNGMVWIAHGQCIEQYGAGEAYLPLLEALGRLCRDAVEADWIEGLIQHAPSWVVHMPALTTAEAFEHLQQRGGAATRERMLRELAEALEVLTVQRSLVLVLEDLHWSDASTLECLSYIARRRDRARLLVLGTFRPLEVVARDHPLRTVSQDLQRQGHSVGLSLNYLSERAVAAYLTERFDRKTIAEALVQALHQRTNGNPLFLINTVDTLVRQHKWKLTDTEASWQDEIEAVTQTLPESLSQLIEQQLEQLDTETQVVLEGASVAGAEFAAAAVAAGLDLEVEVVEERCATLSRWRQFVESRGTSSWPDGTFSERYGFRHAMYREVLYERVRASRRARLHQQIGLRIEAAFGTEAREIAGELAVHFQRGRDAHRAVRYLHLAGENALGRSANQEAIQYLTTGIELLRTTPDTPERIRQELALHLDLGPSLLTTQGYASPQAFNVYTRARELCEQVEDHFQRFRAVWGLYAISFLRGQLNRSLALSQELFKLGQSQPGLALQMEGHRALGLARVRRGEMREACEHLIQALALYDPAEHSGHALFFGHNPKMGSHVYYAIALWVSGYPAQAQQQCQAAIAAAQSHPPSLVFALGLTAMVDQFCRDAQRTLERAEQTVDLSTEHGFRQFLGTGIIFRSWAKGQMDAAGGEAGARAVELSQGIDLYRSTGAELAMTHVLAALAELYGQSGQVDEALRALDEALSLVDKNEERFYEPELHRLRGSLFLMPPLSDALQAEHGFRRALDIARRQGAKSWELRAAISLARLWQGQGHTIEARELLEPIYGWFSEGFDTVDLIEAKGLLEALDLP